MKYTAICRIINFDSVLRAWTACSLSGIVYRRTSVWVSVCQPAVVYWWPRLTWHAAGQSIGPMADYLLSVSICSLLKAIAHKCTIK